MSGTLNRTQLIGHLGADPLTYKLPSGSEVVKFSIATNDHWTNEKGAQKRTLWHDVAVYDAALGEVAKRLTKGSFALVEGQSEPSSYKDKNTGVTHKTYEVALRRSGNIQYLDAARPDAKAKKDAGADAPKTAG